MRRLALAVLMGGLVGTGTWAGQPGPAILIEDVQRFYEVYGAAGGHPSPGQLQHDYLDRGSEGLHELARLRNVTGAAIEKTLQQDPDVYSGARRCMAVLRASWSRPSSRARPNSSRS